MTIRNFKFKLDQFWLNQKEVQFNRMINFFKNSLIKAQLWLFTFFLLFLTYPSSQAMIRDNQPLNASSLSRQKIIIGPKLPHLNSFERLRHRNSTDVPFDEGESKEASHQTHHFSPQKDSRQKGTTPYFNLIGHGLPALQSFQFFETRSQNISAPAKLPSQVEIFRKKEIISPCCQPLRSLTLDKILPYRADAILENSNVVIRANKDPYSTGPSASDSQEALGGREASWNWNMTILKNGDPISTVDFIYQVPQTLGNSHFIQSEILFYPDFPKIKESKNQESYFKRRLTDAINDKFSTNEKIQDQEIDSYITFIDEGSQSRVYFVHNRLDEDLENLSHRERLKHIKTFKKILPKSVVKIRGIQLSTKGLEEVASYIRRDLVIAKLFSDLSSRFTYCHRKTHCTPEEYEMIVEPAPYYSSSAEIEKGFLWQDAVIGTSAYSIAKAIRKAIYASQDDQKKAAIKHIRHVFGFSKKLEDYQILEEAKLRINALESFYRVTSEDVIYFQKNNNLNGFANRSHYDSNKRINVGFDYNHGRNVIWDISKRRFVAIDF